MNLQDEENGDILYGNRHKMVDFKYNILQCVGYLQYCR